MSRRTFRIWMTANSLILVAAAVWILKPNVTSAEDPVVSALATPQPSGSTQAPPVIPTKADILRTPGQRFGLSTPQAPWSSKELDKLATAAGARPTMLTYFVKWTEDFRPDAVKASYDQGALPVVTWEPWAGTGKGINQRAYALSKIISGRFDAYITKFATAVRDQRWPVAIRFAHEMNGVWYPWSEELSGNQKGEYVKAWRHVHGLFKKAGAANVIWIWSPNILRPVPDVALRPLYPGDAYVDWVGMVGYAVRESTAAAVYQPTITALRKFTKKPLVITETGAQPGPRKATWIKDFFRWLPKHPYVVGFVWFEYSDDQGGTADWRFTATAATAKAFRTGLASVKLAAPPTASG